MKRGLYITAIILSVFLISFASAGIFDSIKDALTGHATNQPTNVSANVIGVTPVTVGPIDNTTLTGGVNPTESSTSSATIYGQICDSDGVSDVDDSATDVDFIGPLGTTRSNNSCVLENDVDGSCANFSCVVELYYWDEPGTWTINLSGSDLGNQSIVYNDTYTFQYNQLKAMVIAPSEINWSGLTTGATNVGADNDPTVVNNTGNYDGEIDITGLDLYGATITTEVFGIGNFTADEADPACSAGITLVNNTATTITGTDSNPGNLSAGGGAGQEQIYYCINTVPSLSTQQYTTDKLGSWTILY